MMHRLWVRDWWHSCWPDYFPFCHQPSWNEGGNSSNPTILRSMYTMRNTGNPVGLRRNAFRARRRSDILFFTLPDIEILLVGQSLHFEAACYGRAMNGRSEIRQRDAIHLGERKFDG